jgi:hypothetical protein
MEPKLNKQLNNEKRTVLASYLRVGRDTISRKGKILKTAHKGSYVLLTGSEAGYYAQFMIRGSLAYQSAEFLSVVSGVSINKIQVIQKKYKGQKLREALMELIERNCGWALFVELFLERVSREFVIPSMDDEEIYFHGFFIYQIS